jgi:hypothetical protein
MTSSRTGTCEPFWGVPSRSEKTISPELGGAHRSDGSGAFGNAIDAWVVHHHHPSIAAEMHVQLHPRRARFDPRAKGSDGVFREEASCTTTVSNDTGLQLQIR